MPRKLHGNERDIGSRIRRPKFGYREIFALVSELFYNPKSSLQQLAANLNLSSSSIKRIIRSLRDNGVVSGRVRNLRLHLFELPARFPSFCCAIISVELDTRLLKQLFAKRGQVPYNSEDEFVRWLCGVLPRTAPYRNKIIVERGHILMGPDDRDLELTVFAVSNNSLFDFVRLKVASADGVHRTLTHMAAFSATAEEPFVSDRKRRGRRPREAEGQ
jgi:DNA-binding Lrp family transcriptional regulator